MKRDLGGREINHGKLKYERENGEERSHRAKGEVCRVSQ